MLYYSREREIESTRTSSLRNGLLGEELCVSVFGGSGVNVTSLFILGNIMCDVMMMVMVVLVVMVMVCDFVCDWLGM